MGREALSSRGPAMPGLWCHDRARATLSHPQAWPRRLPLSALPAGLQSLHRHSLRGQQSGSAPSRVVIARYLQRRPFHGASGGVGPVPSLYTPLAEENPSQRLYDPESSGRERPRDGNRRDVSECGGKKATGTPIRPIHHGGAPTSNAGTAPMRMIAPLLWGPLAGKADNAACACVRIPMARRCGSTYRATPRKRRRVTPMNGKATTTSAAPTPPSVTARRNGRAMMTAMACGKCISTPSKDCGPRLAIFCAPFGGSTRSICNTIWRCVNTVLTSNASRPSFSLNSLLSTNQSHEPLGLSGFYLLQDIFSAF